MPCPEIAYITTAIRTSCQPRPQPHRNGTAAITARNGTITKRPSANCSQRDLRSPPTVPRLTAGTGVPDVREASEPMPRLGAAAGSAKVCGVIGNSKRTRGARGRRARTAQWMEPDFRTYFVTYGLRAGKGTSRPHGTDGY